MPNYNYTVLIVSIFSLLFINCHRNAQQEEDKKKPAIIKEVRKTENTVAPKQAVKKKPEVTNKNVKEFLTQYGKINHETIVLLTTDLGDIKIKLYKETPLHRASFIRLIKLGFYNDTYFTSILLVSSFQGQFIFQNWING